MELPLFFTKYNKEDNILDYELSIADVKDSRKHEWYLLIEVFVIVIGPGKVTFTGLLVKAWQFSQISAMKPTFSLLRLTAPENPTK